MKPMSVLAVCAASIAILASACKKDEPASETNTTSAPITQDQPAIQPPVTTGTMDNGTPSDVGNTTAGGATTGNTTTTAGAIQNGTSTAPTGGADLLDKNGQPIPQDQQLQNAQKQPVPAKNHSTTLGDGKSGEYTGGYGTNGGKATWGTGPQKNTKMGQPTTPSTP